MKMKNTNLKQSRRFELWRNQYFFQQIFRKKSFLFFTQKLLIWHKRNLSTQPHTFTKLIFFYNLEPSQNKSTSNNQTVSLPSTIQSNQAHFQPTKPPPSPNQPRHRKTTQTTKIIKNVEHKSTPWLTATPRSAPFHQQPPTDRKRDRPNTRSISYYIILYYIIWYCEPDISVCPYFSQDAGALGAYTMADIRRISMLEVCVKDDEDPDGIQ